MRAVNLVGSPQYNTASASPACTNRGFVGLQTPHFLGDAFRHSASATTAATHFKTNHLGGDRNRVSITFASSRPSAPPPPFAASSWTVAQNEVYAR